MCAPVSQMMATVLVTAKELKEPLEKVFFDCFIAQDVFLIVILIIEIFYLFILRETMCDREIP